MKWFRMPVKCKKKKSKHKNNKNQPNPTNQTTTKNSKKPNVLSQCHRYSYLFLLKMLMSFLVFFALTYFTINLMLSVV